MATVIDPPVTTATEKLLAFRERANPFEDSAADLLDLQLKAVDERFQGRVGRIRLLENRAETGGVSKVETPDDIVPLLFAHTAYKGYPEAWLFEGRWDRMARWLDTVSTAAVTALDGPIDGLDHWLKRLEEEQGHYVGCSSGTTGKCSMMNASFADITFSGADVLASIRWTGIEPKNDRLMVSLGQVAATAKNIATGMPMMQAFNPPGMMPLSAKVPPMTIGGITEMVVLRKKIADGSAKPSEIDHYEALAAERAGFMETIIEESAENLIAHRQMPLHLTGMLASMYPVAERVRAKGYGGKDFQPNTTFLSGGLKGANLPADYREVIFDTFNISEDRCCQAYGMQEMNTLAPRCTHGRYHVAPWVMLLLLDEPGENILGPFPTGEHEGRAAFFDLALDGRWGGVISGDKIKATWEPCACGNRSPSINQEIVRYADLAGGDKITCAGTIDAYVRGAA